MDAPPVTWASSNGVQVLPCGMIPNPDCTRREALQRLGASSLLALGLWPGARAAAANAGSGRRFRFLVVNDLHHAAAACDPWFAALVRQMKSHARVDFTLVLGDLADTAEPASHAAIRDHLGALGHPFYVQLGNHDHRSGGDRSSYQQAFPGRINYRFDHEGWQFLGLDSTQGTASEKTRVQPATLQWLDDQLPRLDKRRPTVVFTHFPLGEGVKMAPLNSEAVLDRFRDHNLQGVFSGHHHAYTLRQRGQADVITNRCCSRIRGNHDGSKAKGYWLMTAEDGRVTREFVEFTGVP